MRYEKFALTNSISLICDIAAYSVPIEHIYAIALQAQRDVLYVKFSLPLEGDESPAEQEYKRLRYWQMLPGREACIAWLDAQGIAFKPCFDFLPESDAAAQVPY